MLLVAELCLIYETNDGDIEPNWQNLTHLKVRCEFQFVLTKSVRIRSSQHQYRCDIPHLLLVYYLFILNIYYSNISFRNEFVPTWGNMWAKKEKLSFLNISTVICVRTSFALTWNSQWCKFLLKWLELARENLQNNGKCDCTFSLSSQKHWMINNVSCNTSP